MNGLNRVILSGYLGNDPEMRTSKNGQPYTHLQMAVKRPRKTEEGTFETLTDWHRILVWGRRGEMCVKYLRKGSPVLVEGHLTIYEDTSSGERPLRKTVVHADQVEFISTGKGIREENSAAVS